MVMIHDPPVQEVHLVWVVGRSMETALIWSMHEKPPVQEKCSCAGVSNP